MCVCNDSQRAFRNEAPLLVEIMLGLLSAVDPSVLLRAGADIKSAAPPKRDVIAVKAEGARSTSSIPAAPAPRKPAAASASGSALRSHIPRLDRSTAAARALAARAPGRHAHSGAVFVRRHLDHGRDVVLRNNPRRQELPARSAAADARQALAHRREGAGAGRSPALALETDPVACAMLHALLDAFVSPEDDAQAAAEGPEPSLSPSFSKGGYCSLMPAVFAQLRPGLLVSTLPRRDFLHFVRLAGLCTRFLRLREEAAIEKKEKKQKEGDLIEPALDGERSPFAGIAATMAYENFHWVRSGRSVWKPNNSAVCAGSCADRNNDLTSALPRSSTSGHQPLPIRSGCCGSPPATSLSARASRQTTLARPGTCRWGWEERGGFSVCDECWVHGALVSM